jgi:peptidoglycan hydrolase CwlO-like protein
MESMNKFKVLTICIIAMFVFVVAAIYSNTKDASLDKTTANTENTDTIYDDSENNVGKTDVATQIKMINGRIDELNARLDRTIDSQSNNLKCKVMGIMTKDGLVEISSDEIVQEAKANGNDIIVSCSL